LHVVVIAKYTPDTAAAVSLDASGQVNWGSTMVVNPWDEYAITEAILMKEAHKASVTVLAVGDEPQQEALKHALAVGADQAIRLWDPALAAADELARARVMAAAVRNLAPVDLVIFGKEFSDTAADQHIFQTARLLGWPALGFVAQIEALDPAQQRITVQRQVEWGAETVAAALPAVISVLKDINEPKYPTFIGIRKAAKAAIPLWSAADLGLSADELAPRVRVTGYRELPKREGTARIIEGATAQEKAERLVETLIEEKAL